MSPLYWNEQGEALAGAMGEPGGSEMIIICAWCQRLLGKKEPVEDERITHGICLECQVKLLLEAKKLREERNKNECD